jgi:hypothetical protein
MKYLNKYNEGIFSSKEIDKKLISDIKKYLEDNYQNVRFDENNNEFIFLFTSDELNYKGEIKISDEYQRETGIKKITKAFSKPSLKFSLYHCDNLGNARGRRLFDVTMFDSSDHYETIINNISSVVGRVRRDIELRQKSQKEKEKLKDKTISKDELEDVIVSLSDICDDCVIKETFVRRTDDTYRGTAAGVYMYFITFTKNNLGFNFKEIKSTIDSRSYGDPKIQIDNLENLKLIIEELDNIKYALKEGWDLDMKIGAKENKIEIEIYEASKK